MFHQQDLITIAFPAHDNMVERSSFYYLDPYHELIIQSAAHPLNYSLKYRDSCFEDFWDEAFRSKCCCRIFFFCNSGFLQILTYSWQSLPYLAKHHVRYLKENSAIIAENVFISIQQQRNCVSESTNTETYRKPMTEE